MLDWYSVIERHFVYFPDRALVATPRDVGLEFEDVQFEASDGVRLHGWFVPGDKEIVWLWVHGNGGNISHRVESLRLLHDQVGVGVLLFDYRGYGRSDGTPSEQGTYLDAEAALTLLSERYGYSPERVVVFGQSLGGAIAVDVAARHRPAGLVVESAFTSIADMARLHYPFLPSRLLLGRRYNSLTKIRGVDAPILIVHGDRDDVIPFDMASELFDAAGEPKHLLVIEGAGHNDVDLVGDKRYFSALRAFIERLEARTSAHPSRRHDRG